MENIDQETKKQIIDHITALLPQAKIYLYGYRTGAACGEWSDIDIALDTGDLLSVQLLEELHALLHTANIPHRIQVVDLQAVPQALQATIQEEGILWKE